MDEALLATESQRAQKSLSPKRGSRLLSADCDPRGIWECKEKLEGIFNPTFLISLSPCPLQH